MDSYRRRMGLSLVVISFCMVVLMKSEATTNERKQQRRINYSQYLNKTWVTENKWGNVGSSNSRSFYITKIEDGSIEGEFSGSVAERRLRPRSRYNEFSGNMRDTIVDCLFVSRPILDYYDGSEYWGKLFFREDNRILAYLSNGIRAVFSI